MTSCEVDCPNKRITLTVNLFVEGMGVAVTPQMLQTIRQAINQAWNPTPRHKYFDCEIHVVLDILTRADRPAGAPPGYNKLRISKLALGGGPLGGGATSAPAPLSPEKDSTTDVTLDPQGNLRPSTIAHELGHQLGIDDPQPTVNWDKNGITPAHIREIIDDATHRRANGSQVGWAVRASCCRAKAEGDKGKKKGKKGKRRVRLPGLAGRRGEEE